MVRAMDLLGMRPPHGPALRLKASGQTPAQASPLPTPDEHAVAAAAAFATRYASQDSTSSTQAPSLPLSTSSASSDSESSDGERAASRLSTTSESTRAPKAAGTAGPLPDVQRNPEAQRSGIRWADMAEDSEDDGALQGPRPGERVPWQGSMGHPDRCALPCKYAFKARGCKDGSACTRCHLCPWTKAGEQKARARAKKLLRLAAKQG
mmetsp:Transcript_50586/g.156551  ORF Transcript_50586/g.156551 Transcript_50586/m.156551 type:complete len:208 (+) Transcript_50586:72-695(+)